MLRQQAAHDDSRPNRSLADFVAPQDAGLSDHIGGPRSAVHGAEEARRVVRVRRRRLQRDHGEGARGPARGGVRQWLHEQSRRSWYAPDEHFGSGDLAAERYRGIRPAFGYPACPDHSEKPTLFSLLAAERRRPRAHGVLRSLPGSSVSGLYFGHPAARYFASAGSDATR